ncbi:MAG TPA: glycosyltransferase, partial [Candidatus Saccharimonadales bacterium]|nr:glycosyltransferase [Candidatus Saccharimonadales bacterium]
FGDLDVKTDRVIFINGHTIINGTLDELMSLDFENNVMALSYDCLLNDHKKTIGLAETDGYFNCGVMLINLKKWKKERITDMLKKHLSEKSDYVIADQDLCNVIFKGQIKLLDSTYNFSSAYYAYNLKRLLKINNLKPNYFYSYEELMENYYSPKIIHSLFGIKGKPWELGNEHPQRYLWNKYIKKTPWKNTKKPVAVRTRNWFLYDVLPNSIFMLLYKFAVGRKFGS